MITIEVKLKMHEAATLRVSHIYKILTISEDLYLKIIL